MDLLSIVIPNSRSFPSELVRELLAQTVRGDEILVVKNLPHPAAEWAGISTERSLRVRTRLYESLSDSRKATDLADIDHQLVKVMRSNSGSSEARNCGWQSAKNKWVLFLDDDVSIPPLFISAVRACIVGTASAGLVTFRVRAKVLERTPSVASSLVSLDRGPDVRRNCSSSPLALYNTWRYGVGAAMLASRELLQATGGFKPDLGAGRTNGGSEDLEFIWHASRHASIEYKGDIEVFHSISEGEIGRKLREYGRAIALLAGARRKAEGLWTVYNYCMHLMSCFSLRPFGARREELQGSEIIFGIAETLRVYLISLMGKNRPVVLCMECKRA